MEADTNKINAVQAKDQGSKIQTQKTQEKKIQSPKMQTHIIQTQKIQEKKMQSPKIQTQKTQEKKIPSLKTQTQKIREEKIQSQKMQVQKIQQYKVQRCQAGNPHHDADSGKAGRDLSRPARPAERKGVNENDCKVMERQRPDRK